MKYLIAVLSAALLTACGGSDGPQACFKLKSEPMQYYRTFVEDCSTNYAEPNYTKMIVRHRDTDGSVRSILTSPADGYRLVDPQSFVSFSNFVDIRYCIVHLVDGKAVEDSCVDESFSVK